MADCEQIRPLIFPYLEREAEPAEAIEVANHLSSCTACKILAARKRRLGQMLEEDLHDRIPVGEDFVRSVMANLPEGPPPECKGRKRKRSKRRFDLAVLFGIAVAVGPVIAARAPVATGSRGVDLPTVALPSVDGLTAGFELILRLVVTAAGTLLGGGAVELATLPAVAGAAMLALLMVAGSFVLLGSSAVLTLAATSMRRLR